MSSELYNKVINEIAVAVKRSIETVDELDYVPFSNQSTVDEDLKLLNILSETYGAFSVPDKDGAISKFIDTITNTFFLKKNFFKYEIQSSDEYIDKFGVDYFKVFPTKFPYKKKIFAKTFKTNNISWLKELTIVLAPNPLASDIAVADTKNEEYNVYRNECIERATIVFVNMVSDIVIIEHKLYHELKHLYSEFSKRRFSDQYDSFQKVHGKLPDKSEALNWVFKRVCSKLANGQYWYTFDSNDKDVDYADISTFAQFANDEKKLKKVLYSLFYFCNQEEISAHLEEITSEISSYFKNYSKRSDTISETYKRYENIYNVLDYLYTNVPHNIWKPFIKEISDTMNELLDSVQTMREKYAGNIVAEQYFSKQEEIICDSQKIICNYKHLVAEMRKNIKHMLIQARKQISYFANNRDGNYLP